MNLQEKIDEVYPRYYDYEVNISKEQWKELLHDPEVFDERNLEHLKCLYSFDNHAATCKEVSEKLGNTAQYFVGLGTSLARKVARKLGVENLPTRDGNGGDVFWYILFYGQEVRDRQRGNFEWKLRPELADALKETFPALDYPDPIVLRKLDDVPTAVWIGTALLTYQKVKFKHLSGEEAIFHKNTEIQKVAEQISSKRVDPTRILQWCNGDHPKHSWRFLREGHSNLKRLTAPGEFNGVKERPANLDFEMEFVLENVTTTVGMLVDFVEGDYADLITEAHKEIDLEIIEQYLDRYAGVTYILPEKAKEQKEYMDQLKTSGLRARENFTELGKRVLKRFPEYIMGKCSNWVNQAQKVPDYFWIEFKKKGFQESKSSLSLFSWKTENHVYFYTSVEARDTACMPEDFKKHNRLIYLEKTDPEIYYRVEVEKDQYEIMDVPRKEIVKLLENNELIKIRAEIGISGPYANTATKKIVDQIELAFKKLEPYYHVTIGEVNMNGNEGTMAPTPVIGGQEFSLNTILYGPPGTGKTYHTVLYAVAVCDKVSLKSLKDMPYQEVMDRYEELKKEGRIAFTTFHQSYGYEEFIEGIKPVISQQGIDVSSEIQYEYSSGVFKKFCEKAKMDIKDGSIPIYTQTVRHEESKEPFVFIIDEINRGNISKIFGELITLIETTKRLGEDEATTAILPYTGDEFGVPNNVFIIGTMNTADRSIALMDTALRRRFKFIEMMPDENVLKGIENVEGIDVPKMLKTINERIEFLYDREHTIGHAYFTSLAVDPSLTNLAGIFLNSIIPLLQEYFYEDYSKIQLVLGDNAKEDAQYKFILDKRINEKEIFKGNIDMDLPEKRYSIQTEAFYQAESYKSIY
jgi:5-methylcytosine-specific restriction endonuclease McrBC GTP-binding regulatory subunit McrB